MREKNSSSQALDEALGALLRLLKRRRIPHMLMGGLALSIWGRVRVTQDVDVGVALDEQEEARFLQDLQKAHFLPAAPQAMVGHRLLVCRYLKTTKGLPVEVDLFFARGTYQKQALRRSVAITLGHRRIHIIAPEDLILHKLLADRPIDRMDIQGILEEQAGRLNMRYLSRWCKLLGLSKRLSEMLPAAKTF